MSTANHWRRGSTTIQVVLCAMFLVPLSLGVYLSAASNRRSTHAHQVSHDLASMYAQGVDFSQAANRSIADRLLDPHDGKTVVIFTRLHTVSPTDCGTDTVAQCTNSGYAVITQRIVIGEPELYSSSYGVPNSIDPSTGNVLNWTTDSSARVTDSGLSLKPGESAYAAETFIAGPDDRTGVYARTMF